MKIQPHFIRTGFIAFFLLFTGGLSAQEVNLSKASIIATKSIQSPLRETVIRILQEEVLKRTTISLTEVSKSDNSSLIVLASLTDTVIDGLRVPKRQGDNLPEAKGEGFRRHCGGGAQGIRNGYTRLGRYG